MDRTLFLTTGRKASRLPLSRWIGGIVLVTALAYPLTSNGYDLSVWTSVMIFAGIASAWALVGGLAGLLPLGHGLFIGIGAYTTVVLSAEANISPWVGMLVGAMVAGGAGYLVMFLAVRFGVRGAYFALYTMAFAEAARILVSNTEFLGKTTGMLIPYRPDAGAAHMQFTSGIPLYLIAILYLLLVAAIFALVRGSALGWKLQAIRSDEDTAAASGIGISQVLNTTMTISAALAGLGGGLYAVYLHLVDPQVVFSVAVSIDVVVRAVLGGAAFVLGPLVGSGIMTGISEGSRAILGEVPTAGLMVVGIAIVIVAEWLPAGALSVLSIFRKTIERISGRRERAPRLTPADESGSP